MFLTIPPSIIQGAAAAENVTPARAATIMGTIPAATANALATFGRSGTHTYEEWIAAFPAFGPLPENERQFVIRVVMDGIGGAVVES